MQAADDDGTGATGGAERGASAHDGPDGPGGPPDPVDAGQEAGASNRAPPNDHRRTSLTRARSTVSVPFPLALEAEIARHYLMMNARRLGRVQKLFSVEENVFTARLLSVDPVQLQVSIIACLDQIAKVVRRILRHLQPFCSKPRDGKGG
ncbi:PREDICTED: EKC/KEOPS complex subunit LAGE3-like [Chrysochloris asiatica]|uniref:EKC/KEOPS complex subunit LAGE3-like n=1 Tax=Chrysochloris asiatica TaxID=185453 RepID=A0A9B0U8E1_CHRAS|nr:PREDICTED: EKC/KEOPS complex subunit LAGE3-like [Chrysochloris asiatica]